jgi:hypothetical protein
MTENHLISKLATWLINARLLKGIDQRLQIKTGPTSK